MKTTSALIQRGKGFFFLMMLLFACSIAFAQTPPTIYLHVLYHNVAPGNVGEFEKIMKENFKPMNQLRKQNGKILNWSLYKIHYKGTDDPYNYVSVVYYDSFNKTEPNDNWLELMKAANPKVDANAIFEKANKLRSIVGQNLYRRTESVSSKTPLPIKYIVASFQKSKPGMHEEALKMETEEWKPIHQPMIDANQMIMWNVWELIMPSGTEVNHDYFTSNIFSSYDQVAMEGYSDAIKKSSKDYQKVIDRTTKAKNMVKRELLEFVMGL